MALVPPLIVILAALLLSAWLARRSRRTANSLLRRLGPPIFGLSSAGLAAVALVALVGWYRLEFPRNHQVATVKVVATPESIARGEKLANLCVSCHTRTKQLPLDGSDGNVVRTPLIGRLHSPNLTPAGPLKDWSDGEIIRAIREGIGANGRPLLGMPSWSFRYLSDRDVQSLVAYLRSQPSVTHTVPSRSLTLLAALAVGIGMAPTSVQPPITQTVPAPQAAVSAEYGRYLVAFAGCRDCHGKNLNGGTAPLGIKVLSPTPLGPSLLVAAQLMSQSQFVSTMRTGLTRNGRPLNPELMPWQDFSRAFTDDELKAIYLYLNTVDSTAASTP